MVANTDLNVLAVATANFQRGFDHDCAFPAALPSQTAFLGMSELWEVAFPAGAGIRALLVGWRRLRLRGRWDFGGNPSVRAWLLKSKQTSGKDPKAGCGS